MIAVRLSITNSRLSVSVTGDIKCHSISELQFWILLPDSNLHPTFPSITLMSGLGVLVCNVKW